MSLSFPAATLCPSTVAITPCPPISCTSVTRCIQFPAIGFLQADTDRMCAVALCQCRVFQQLFFLFRIYRMSGHNRTAAGCTVCSMNSADFKYPLRNCPCLIKDNRACSRKCFQIVGTFYQNTLCTGTSDSCKKLSGILMTSAHGQLITRNVSAR